MQTCWTRLVVCAAVAGCHAEPDAQPTKTVVRVTPVVSANSATPRRLTARIEPLTQVDLAFKVGGYVAAIGSATGAGAVQRELHAGDAVAAGMLLAHLVDNDYALRVREAQAALAQASAGLEQGKLDAQRLGQLAGHGAVASAEVDAARLRLTAAQAAELAARTRLDSALATLADTRLRSPIAGTLLRRSLEVGNLVAPGSVVFSVAQASQVKALVAVPDALLERVPLGSEQMVASEAWPDRSFKGTVTRIAPAAERQAGTFEVEITLENPGQVLKVGSVAELTLGARPLAPGAADTAVPLNAIVRSPGGHEGFVVFAVDAAASAHARVHAVDVTLGEVWGALVPVAGKLAVNDRIVVQGAGLLCDGEDVEVIP